MKAVLALASALVLLLFGVYERGNTSDVRSIGILMWMLTVVVAGTIATVFLAPSSQLFSVKLFRVVVLSVLPRMVVFSVRQGTRQDPLGRVRAEPLSTEGCEQGVPAGTACAFALAQACT